MRKIIVFFHGQRTPVHSSKIMNELEINSFYPNTNRNLSHKIPCQNVKLDDLNFFNGILGFQKMITNFRERSWKNAMILIGIKVWHVALSSFWSAKLYFFIDLCLFQQNFQKFNFWRWIQIIIQRIVSA